ncbi:TQO small subunit DoxA [Saccharicrinis fermentans DSM 9555 = JCM 21142]|uniref:TQO small subunit DoxA n=1 Tax=Saccharicrinis fermentans DSM 9555 = JCM 21142 TaxID=869213 RepID=W7Y4G3_9BACT|nr:TQO small subunit DoxA [Saccharicrinis fermentans DSM 9555 = JCM 21142]
MLHYGQDDLTSLRKESILNNYVVKIKPGKYSLIVPLGAKATLRLKNEKLEKLPRGVYALRVTDISGVYWECEIVKSE